MIEARNSEAERNVSSAENDEANAAHESPKIAPIETPGPEIIQTLPSSLNTMIGESVEFGTEHTQELIKILGKKIGIVDYRTNLAAFWLLDAMALEVIRTKHKMNPVNLGILISWIAGEAKLIHEKLFSRPEFFREMGFIFTKISDRLGEGLPLIYWEEIPGNSSPPKEQQLSAEDEQEEAASRPISEHRFNVLDDLPVHENLEVASVTSDNLSNPNGKPHMVLESSMEVLEAIIESTYAMLEYANAFHYASVFAAFAQPVEIHLYRLPYTLRLPRPVKLPVLPSLRTEATNKATGVETRSKIDKGKSGKNKGREKIKSKIPTEIQPPMITEDEMLAQKRKQILPLIESNEAPHFLEKFARPPSSSLITETGRGKKGKRKT